MTSRYTARVDAYEPWTSHRAALAWACYRWQLPLISRTALSWSRCLRQSVQDDLVDPWIRDELLLAVGAVHVLFEPLMDALAAVQFVADRALLGIVD